MTEQGDREALRAVLRGIDRQIAEMRVNRSDLGGLKLRIERLFAHKRMSGLQYALETESMSRTSQDIQLCLRHLDRQKKLALKKLQELE